MEQKGMTFDRDFYVVVGKQCRTEMRTRVTNTISLYKLSNVLLFFICFRLVIKLRYFVNLIFILIFQKNIPSMLKT